VQSIVEQQVKADGLRGVLARVDVGNRTLGRIAVGNSIAGVRTNFRMHFRIGSIAIPYVIDVLLQLQDAGRLSLDDPLSKWLPELRDGDRVTLRMLANSTSCYADWAQENPAFINTLYANVFRQWTTNELLKIALARPVVCAPGTCFHYAHTNFVILDKVIHRVTGRPVAQLLRPTRPAPARTAPHGDLGAA
jgi:D-alanyl-D-alanine carboxypeptidase